MPWAASPGMTRLDSRFILVGPAVVASNPTKHLGEEIMNRRSLIICAAAALGAFTLSGNMAQAADVKVLTSVALKSVLDELSPAFEKKTGHKLIIDYGLSVDQKKRILGGEHADLIILTRGMMEDLAKQNKPTADGLVNLAGTPVAVTARAGAPKPDISTVGRFQAGAAIGQVDRLRRCSQGRSQRRRRRPRHRASRHHRSDESQDHPGARRAVRRCCRRRAKRNWVSRRRRRSFPSPERNWSGRSQAISDYNVVHWRDWRGEPVRAGGESADRVSGWT